ncbi:MATE family efflux transporter [Vibrio sp.]|uniref:MATE family efflux transporter n=1 Tax=Vibrio sp. TaxID=678 RepID=UPI003D11BF1E
MNRYKKESKNLVSLATPVLIASVAQTGMGFVDTVMAGGVSPIDMAAVSVAASIWLPSILFGMGLLMALVPIVAQLNGSLRTSKIPYEIQQGIYLALVVSLPTILVLMQTRTILTWMDVESLLANISVGYMDAVIYAVVPFLLFQALRSLTDGMSLTKPAMVIGFIGLLLNIPLNWIFVYGKFGITPYGGIGCGIATAIVYWAMFFMLLGYVVYAKRLQKVKTLEQFYAPNLSAMIRLTKLGFPVAAALFFEVSIFAIIALLIAPLGSLIVAAHQVAMNFSSLVFMLPMSIASAVSIRVGHQLGEEDVDGAAIASRIGLLFGLSIASVTALLTLTFRESIALLYTDDAEVIAYAGQLLLFAAIYQCTDAVQVIAAGALRGYKDMTAIFNRTFIAYWLLGLPSGYILANTNWFGEPLGASGFWIGLIVGLSSAALMLYVRLRWMHHQDENIQLEFASK